MQSILYRPKWWFSISGALMIVSIIFILLGGLKFGIDFTGGSFLQVTFEKDRPTTQAITKSLQKVEDIGHVSIQPVDDRDTVLRMKTLSNDQRSSVLLQLQNDFGGVSEKAFSSVGPTIGRELKQKALLAIVIVLGAIVVYIAWAFRGVSRGPISPWTLGWGAIIALFHDILLTTGLFAVLGYFFDVEIDALFITALLTILGFSVHDTIVVYDRIRERLTHYANEDFRITIIESVRQTLTRSLNTTLTTLLVLSALLLFTKGALMYFLIALLAGFVFGTYSSIFIASPLLNVFRYLKGRRMVERSPLS